MVKCGDIRISIPCMVLLLVCGTFLSGFGAEALEYDYFATVECLQTPLKPQYNGGIIRNPEFDNGLNGWLKFGNPKINHRLFQGNNFIVVHSRDQSFDSISQKIYMQRDKLYTFSAWIQVSEDNIPVTALFKTTTGIKHAGAVIAQSKCWSMIKGGVTVDESGIAELYFEAKNTSVEIWIDSVSLQFFTKEEWKSHQDQSVKTTRQSKIKIHVVDKENRPLTNANITIEPNKLWFPFGCAINKNILTNTAYQNWFTSRFRVTTFEDEMKWYSTENTQGKEDYSVADAMLWFTQKHGISVRAHNVFWDDPKYQPGWVLNLSPAQLPEAAQRRIVSIMKRYRGKVIGWDVVNENLHFSLFESKLGADTSAYYYRLATALSGGTTLFLNDYNTIEDSRDSAATPAKYIQKIKHIQAFRGDIKNLGIGLESHFKTPNIPYMRAAIDTLASMGLPIWLTEVDVESSSNQAKYLEQILREGHAHPSVKGIVIWSAWRPQGCYRMCLTDNNFNNLATGNVVDKLLREWGLKPLSATTDSEGFFEASLYHGNYQVKVTHPSMTNSSLLQELEVASSEETQQRLFMKLTV